jgi:hypothetical protein
MENKREEFPAKNLVLFEPHDKRRGVGMQPQISANGPTSLLSLIDPCMILQLNIRCNAWEILADGKERSAFSENTYTDRTSMFSQS